MIKHKFKGYKNGWVGEKEIKTNINNLDQRRSKDIVQIFEIINSYVSSEEFIIYFSFIKNSIGSLQSINIFMYIRYHETK
jgi:hypothetical protein